ncbi:type IV secretion protein Rhs [Bacillus thuringiensis F14-1]|nr:type IV secretion protein Rhs [Bacillus thuringiensis F14-1]
MYVYNKDGVRLAMTDKDGQIVASYEYDAWGNVLKSEAKGIAADNPFGYAGYMYDKEIGMYYLIARYYNPEHDVFLSVDPDGHWVWFAVNAGFAAYDGYKAYKSGKGWKGVAKAAAIGAIGGGKLKLTKTITKPIYFTKLLGKNARAHKSRINKDLPGGKAVAKSIFRHYTKGQKVINHRKGNSVRRHTKDNRIQIRMVKRKDGTWKVNLDIKRKRIYEDIHF